MKRSLALLSSLLLALSISAQRHSVVYRPQLPGSPRLSTEIPVSGITYEGDYGGDRPRIAAGPHQALVVWSHGAVRVDASGKPLDLFPLIDNVQDVWWNGTKYVAAILRGTVISLVEIDTDGRVGAPVDLEETANANVRVAMDRNVVVYSALSPEGQFSITALIVSHGVVEKRIALGMSGFPMSRGRVVASPAGVLVLWPDNYRVIDGAGNVTGGALPRSDVDAVWNGVSWIVASAGAAGVSVFPISSDGAVGVPSLVHHTESSMTSSVYPAIGWNGSEYRILWQEFLRSGYSGGTFDLYDMRVAVNRTQIEERLLEPAIWWTDNRFVPGTEAGAIAAIDGKFIGVYPTGTPTSGSALRNLYAVNLNGGTTELLTRRAASQFLAALVATPSSARVIWSSLSDSFSASVDRNGRLGAVKNPGAKPYAAYAWNGVDTVAAWAEYSNSSNSFAIFGALLDGGGNIVSKKVLARELLPASVQQIDCNAHDCAMVWSSNEQSFFQRFTFNLTPIDQPLPIPIGFRQLSGRGDEYLLIFQWNHLIATRYAGGKLSDVTELGVDGLPVTVASKPDGWLVVAPPQAIHLDANAAIIARTELPSTVPVSATWDGRYWIAAWSDGADIHVARIAPDGTLVDQFLAAATSQSESSPIVRSAGSGLTALAYTRSTNDRVYGATWRVFVRWIE